VAHPARDTLIPEDPSGYGEAYEYLGSSTADGSGAYFFAVDTTVEPFSKMSMTATDGAGNTSEMSPNFYLLPQPMIITAYVYDPVKGGFVQNGVNIMVTDPNGDQYGMNEFNVIVDEIPGDQYYFVTAAEDDSLIIPTPIIGDYVISFIGSGDGTTGSLYAGIIKIDGSLSCTIVINEDVPGTGQMQSFNYTYDENEALYSNGDANSDWDCNVGDAVFIINYVFKGGPAPVPVLAGDANCDGDANVGDAVYIINYVFKGGDPPCHFEM
jgi:hypothetical protein